MPGAVLYAHLFSGSKWRGMAYDDLQGEVIRGGIRIREGYRGRPWSPPDRVQGEIWAGLCLVARIKPLPTSSVRLYLAVPGLERPRNYAKNSACALMRLSSQPLGGRLYWRC